MAHFYQICSLSPFFHPLLFSYWCFLHWIFTIFSSSPSPLNSLSTHGNTYHFPLSSVISPWGCLLHPLSPSSCFHWFSSASSASNIHFLSALYPYLHSPFLTFYPFLLHSPLLLSCFIFQLCLPVPHKVGNKNRTSTPVKFMACFLILSTSDTSSPQRAEVQKLSGYMESVNIEL